MFYLGMERFLLGGWAGASEGRVLTNFFTNWGGQEPPGEGQTCFVPQQGEVHSFFGKEKITPCRFHFAKQSYQSRLNSAPEEFACT